MNDKLGHYTIEGAIGIYKRKVFGANRKVEID